MDFDYGDEELDYFIGVTMGIRFFRYLDSIGFPLNPNQNYYVDFNGYHISQGSYQDYEYDVILASTISPLLAEGSIIEYSGSCKKETVQIFTEKGIGKPSYDETDRDGFVEEMEIEGVYLYLNHPKLLKLIDMTYGTEAFEEVEKILDRVRDEETLYYSDSKLNGKENQAYVDKTGFYFFVSCGLLYYADFMAQTLSLLAELSYKTLKEAGDA